ncbi:hypothetical protein OHA72_23075 [Dactylosporangium sp. NBC_01737]|uniref:hypothetical protein n=1 Tax=Dactylosporangium sp. NBC_01737 TaxID=2975959 RepID=UPI002E0D5128|nr:hypothetical protein OHA72_23075 [Dactylosporangium sp. NBC_01737]
MCDGAAQQHFSIFFNVASQSYLSELVGKDELVAGNARLEVLRNVNYAGGLGVAGWIIQGVGAARPGRRGRSGAWWRSRRART